MSVAERTNPVLDAAFGQGREAMARAATTLVAKEWPSLTNSGAGLGVDSL
jgi:hypothetical protein